MINPSTVPIPNVKLKRVSKLYHVLYNYSVGKNTMSKYQGTEEFTRKVCTILYYINMTTCNKINYKCLKILIMHLYILV